MAFSPSVDCVIGKAAKFSPLVDGSREVEGDGRDKDDGRGRWREK